MQRSYYVTSLIIKITGFTYAKYVHTNSHRQQENEELSFVTYSLFTITCHTGLFLYFING